MKERPIIFSAEMVRAILANRKFQTRRVIKPQPILGQPWRHGWIVDPIVIDVPIAYCPYGISRDYLWVKETFQMWADVSGKVVPHYKADYPHGLPFDMKWRPSIFMPRWASRIILEMVDVRVERIQDAIRDDILAEGLDIAHLSGGEFLYQWIHLWDSINAKRGFSWDSNCWVWAIEFKVAHPTGR